MLEKFQNRHFASPRIAAPADDTLLALEPDIPSARQRVRFTADAQGLKTTACK
jgi:hypothetical protein